MARELDTRPVGLTNRTVIPPDDLVERVRVASGALAGDHRLEVAAFDEISGHATHLISLAAEPGGGDVVARALDHVTYAAPVFGLVDGAPPEYRPDPHPQVTSSGAQAVHLHQQHRGIPVFHARLTVRFRPDGAIGETVGSSVLIPPSVGAEPALSAAQAVTAVAQYLTEKGDEPIEHDQFGNPRRRASVDVSGFAPTPIAAPSHGPDRTVIFDAGPFGGPISASLTWFPQESGAVLGWSVEVSMPGGAEGYRVVADAASVAILYCHQTVLSVAARGFVFSVDPRTPRTLADFPQPIGNFPFDPMPPVPSWFPDGWVDVDTTSGNNCSAAMEGGSPVKGSSSSGSLDFDHANTDGFEQWVVNAFYLCNYAHDYFFILGFRESDGCYQRLNSGRGPGAGDEVQNVVFDREIDGTANFAPSPEGIAPICQLGTNPTNNGSRNTALDASVVIHEYSHGVSTRLVGGRTNVHSLDDPQSGGMGEGWSDFFACSALGTDVVGRWLVGSDDGIRTAPYREDYPNTFETLSDPTFSRDVHNIGEVWCATLMSLSRALSPTFVQSLVIDAMKLGPSNPSFLDERDAIYSALNGQLEQADAAGTEPVPGMDSDQVRATAHEVFARYGMGPNARSANAGLASIEADFEA